MKLLILTAFYPVPNGTHERMFVHVRDRYYAENGIDVTVLNFAADSDYTIDGIKVITLATYESESNSYDIAVCHSANVRNHYKFLKKYESRFKRLVFFFHGHEVLYLNKDYPKPYDYMNTARLHRILMQNMYDRFKLSVWKKYYKKLAYKSEFVFVSKWVLEHFKKNIGMTEADLKNHCHVINNSIGAFFETADYDIDAPKEYDYISIRSNLDGSKYCIDIVTDLAEKYPEKKFLIIGKGKFFDYRKKPDNVELVANTVNHEEMRGYLDKSRCGILLTKQDTQGVMTCELAAYGIPVITSDIEVCHEFFENMENVALVPNDADKIDLDAVTAKLCSGLPYKKNRTYFAENTISREVSLFNEMLK